MISFLDGYIQALSGVATRKRKLETGECQTAQGLRCSLCSAVDITYEQELIVKQIALQTFWKASKLPGTIEPLIPSPLGRQYRTVSKRKAFRIDGKVRLALMELEDSQSPPFRPLDIVKCMIEPDDHRSIYLTVQRLLEKPFASSASAALNYVIIKGSYAEHTVIFSMSTYNPSVSKAVSRLSKLLLESCETIVSFFLFIDEGGAISALFAAEDEQHRFKRLIGKKEVSQTVAGRPYGYSALSYALTNLSIAEPIVLKAQELLVPQRTDRLFHLFCTFGMYVLALSERITVAVGIDPSESSIDLAKTNMLRHHVLNCKFIRGEMNETTFRRVFKGAGTHDLIVYTPPKKFASKGVIDFLALHKVKKVLHVFNEIDSIPADVLRWKKRNYHVTRVIPFDAVPGLAGIETMMLLERE